MPMPLNGSTVLQTISRSARHALGWLARTEHWLSRTPAHDALPSRHGGWFATFYCGAFALFGNMLDYLIEQNAWFGGQEKMLPVRFSFFGRPAVLITKPQHVYQALKDQEHFSPSSDPQMMKRFERFLGFNLVVASDDVWRAVRPRTAALLAGRPLAEYGDLMREVMAEEFLPLWQRAAAEQTPVDISEHMFLFSSKVAFRAFLRLDSAEVPDRVHPALNRLFSHVKWRVLKPSLPMWVPTPANREFQNDRRVLRDFVRPYVDAHKTRDTMLGSIIRAHTRRCIGTSLDLRLTEYLAAGFGQALSVLGESHSAGLARAVGAILEAQQDATVHRLGKALAQAGADWAKETNLTLQVTQEQLEAGLESILCEGGEVNQEMVLQEMVSNLIGGTETTILMMTWGLYFLSSLPHVQEKLHREAAANGGAVIPDIAAATMRECWPYLYNVLRESLRLGPPAALFNRPVIKDVKLDGFEFKRGTLLWGSPYITHRSPYIWKDAERFIPERWDQPVPTGAFLPFSLGPRTCVGSNYAYLEAGIGFATLMKYFTVECLTKALGYEVGLTFRPDRPVKILLRAR